MNTFLLFLGPALALGAGLVIYLIASRADPEAPGR